MSTKTLLKPDDIVVCRDKVMTVVVVLGECFVGKERSPDGITYTVGAYFNEEARVVGFVGLSTT